jgi:glutamine synthetase
MSLAAWLADRGIEHVHAGAADHLGIWRGKRVSVTAAAAGPIGFSDGVFGLDFAGEWVPAPAGHTGWYPSSYAGYPDMRLALDGETALEASWLDGEAMVLGSWELPDGRPLPVCPRGRLRAVLDALAARGLGVQAAFELELYLLPLGGGTLHDRAYPYHALRTALDRGVVAALTEAVASGGAVVEAAGFENGVGQLEINVAHRDALAAADEAFVLKQALRVAAARLGLRATFMARPFTAEPGSSAHIHLSLTRDGAPAGDQAHRQALAGMLETLPAAVALCLPFANSYTRLQPHSLAATTRTWAPENRTVALRTIERGGHIERIEHRLPGADCNPYHALAAVAAGILTGLTDGLDPPAATLGNCDELDGLEPLPRTPAEAVAALRAAPDFAALVGRDLAAHACVMLDAEAESDRRRVGDEDRARYLELA